MKEFLRNQVIALLELEVGVAKQVVNVRQAGVCDLLLRWELVLIEANFTYLV